MSKEVIVMLQFLIPIFLLLIGWNVGRIVERNHFRRLAQGDYFFKDMMVTSLKSFPGDVLPTGHATLVVGQCVITSDYMKNFLTALRKIFGGEMGSMETLQIRARQEALLRMKQEARAQGYNAVCNVRYDTSMVSDIYKKSPIVAVGVIASGTAYRVRLEARPR